MLKANELTNGERLLILRRRQGETAAGYAGAHGVSLYRYNRWERDEEKGPAVRMGRLAWHEMAFVLRRRSGMSVAAFAKRLGVTAWWLTQMERGQAPDGRLRRFWKCGRKATSPARPARKRPAANRSPAKRKPRP